MHTGKVYDFSITMKVKNALQVSFLFQTEMLSVFPSRKYSLERIRRLNKHLCLSRVHPKVLKNFFWKWFLSLQVTLGWVILTWAMWKFTATFCNCKFCSTELNLDYSDNKILQLQDLWSMRRRKNLWTACYWQEDTWTFPLLWQICQIWIIHLF